MIAAGDAMDLTQARLDLARALEAAAAAPHAADRFRAARRWLIARGTEALHIDPAAAPDPEEQGLGEQGLGEQGLGEQGLGDIVRRAVRAPAGPARRVFAIVLVDALAVPGLLSARPSQARLERDIQALLESALPDVLLRAGYPFAGDQDAKRRSLAALAASIDEHLRPLEPTFPAWLSGLPDR